MKNCQLAFIHLSCMNIKLIIIHSNMLALCIVKAAFPCVTNYQKECIGAVELGRECRGEGDFQSCLGDVLVLAY